MAAELVNAATSEKLKEMDWMKNIEICELVARDQGQARDVIKAIKKRLGDKNSNSQLFSVMLLEMLMNNCGEHIHKQVIDAGLLPILVKIVKKKSDLPVREKIFHLLDATQTSLGGASGKFPQYHAAYFELVTLGVIFRSLHLLSFYFLSYHNLKLKNAGIQFPQTPHVCPSDIPSSKAHKNNLSGRKPVSPKHEGVTQQSNSQIVPESSIIEKAGTALEVLREVLDAIDTQHPERAKDEFTLDLVEQCSFEKQRVMHLVMTSRDEKVVSQAIELNEQLQKVLTRHDALLSVRAASAASHFDHEEAEEEEGEQLFRRLRKGKACARPEGKDHLEQPVGMLGSIQGERLHRPIIRPLCLEPQESRAPPPAVVIPPPPAKRTERERFFQEKQVDSTTLAGLSLHSRNSSSQGGSVDSSD